MSAAAKPVGAELVEREQGLDQLFAQRAITADRLAAETAAIAELQGRLRRVHLAAHLQTRVLLSADQIALYQRLRGYGDDAADGGASSPQLDPTADHCLALKAS